MFKELVSTMDRRVSLSIRTNVPTDLEVRCPNRRDELQALPNRLRLHGLKQRNSSLNLLSRQVAVSSPSLQRSTLLEITRRRRRSRSRSHLASRSSTSLM